MRALIIILYLIDHWFQCCEGSTFSVVHCGQGLLRVVVNPFMGVFQVPEALDSTLISNSVAVESTVVRAALRLFI